MAVSILALIWICSGESTVISDLQTCYSGPCKSGIKFSSSEVTLIARAFRQALLLQIHDLMSISFTDQHRQTRLVCGKHSFVLSARDACLHACV